LDLKIETLRTDIAKNPTSMIVWLCGMATVGAAVAGFIFNHIP